MPFLITLRDRTVELVDDADTFANEKAMTTFYRTGNARRTIDCWSVPVASVRTDEILMVREVAGTAEQLAHADVELRGVDDIEVRILDDVA